MRKLYFHVLWTNDIKEQRRDRDYRAGIKTWTSASRYRLSRSFAFRSEAGWRGGGCTHAMHGRSGMTMNLRIPTMPRRGMLDFSPTRQKLLAPSATRREVLGASHEG